MSDEINKLLENVRQKLLDTGTRNRLVHVNRKNSRANVLNITEERSEDVYQILRVQNKKMRFGALGEDENEQDSDEVKLPAIRDESKYTDNWLDTPLTTERLEKRLLRLASDARTVEEEQGVNLLYLSLGFLSWYEDENSEILREAPLILLPVRLTRNQKTSTYEIECRDDDIVTNLSLQARLSEFPVDLPTIDDSEEWTPSEYFQRVEEAIEGQSRWSLDVNGIQLGFFSFAKY